MELSQTKQALLDEVLAAYGQQLHDDGADPVAAVTLGYTHNLHRLWRTALRMLPVNPGSSILDVGCGFGVLSFDLAANLPVDVEGIDIEARFVGHADRLLSELDDRRLFAEGSTVRFSEGDICSLAASDDSLDLVFARELLQFVPDPLKAVGELFRVVKPGGYACVSDTDDQLHITWPPPSPAQARLVDAVRSLHYQRGGDRQTGRKLSTYIREAGFELASIVVLPEAQHRHVDDGDAERALIVEQLHAARDRIVQSGTMTGPDFDATLADLEGLPPHDEFRMNACIIVLGRKPART